MRKAFALLALAALALSPGAKGFAQEKPKHFSVGLYGGYNVVSMLVRTVDWKTFDDRRTGRRTNDDSYIDLGPLTGLSFSYLPVEKFVTAGFTVELFYQQVSGRLKGTVLDPEGLPGDYDFDTFSRFYQLNFLCTLFFTRNAFQPYLQLGMGALRNDEQIDSYHQTAYGATGVIGWGAQYRVAPWVALGGQVRMQDLFGTVTHFEPEGNSLLTIESQYVPLALLLHTTFYF